MERHFTCEYCAKTFRSYFGLRSHIGLLHKTTIDPKCDICGETFMHRIQLSRHKNKVHIEEKTMKGQMRNTVKCGECGTFLSTVMELGTHLKDEHNLDIRIQEFTFQTRDEFDAWRKECETAKRFEFRLTRGRRPKKTGDQKMYLYCHRSGFFNSDSKGVRASRKTNRINFHCCAFAVAQVTMEGIKVKACLEHYGHDNHLLRIRISKETRQRIVQYIREGRSFEWIQSKLRENIMQKTSDGSFVASRENLIKRQDIFNILSQMRQRALVEGTNDAHYVDIWKATNMNLKNSTPRRSNSAAIRYFTSSDHESIVVANVETGEPIDDPIPEHDSQQQVDPNLELTESPAPGSGPLLSRTSVIWDVLKTRSINDPAIAEEIFKKTKEIELLYDLAEKKEAAKAISTLRNMDSLKKNASFNQELEKEKCARDSNTSTIKRQLDMFEDEDDEMETRKLKEFIMKTNHFLNV